MNLRCAAALCVLLAAAGCGQRGPLYLPGDPNEGRIVLPPTEETPGTADGEAAEPENPQEPREPDNSEDDEQ